MSIDNKLITGDKYTKIADKGYGELIDQLEHIEGEPEVTIGFYAGNNSEGSEGMSIAEYMYINEVGTEEIPARPLQADTADKFADEMYEFIMDGLQGIAEGDLTIEALLHEVGIKYQGILKKEQVAWDDPPNAPETVEEKGEDNPLIDDSVAVNAIKYKTDM